MTSRFSKLFLAAAVAASLPLAAAADDCDHGRERRHDVAYPAPWRPAPPAHRGHEASWRERELREVRAALHALDAERARFHAQLAGRPGKLRRYDRTYFERRAALERRWSELQMVAWR